MSAPPVAPGAPWRPPAPVPLPPVRSLVRAALSGERDLLSLVPEQAYTELVFPLAGSKRGIVYVNDPALVHRVMQEHDRFPKNDLFVDAVEPLVGDSIFVSTGATWRRQRRMIDPAFGHMRVNLAWPQMAAAVDDHEAWLDAHAARGDAFSLDAAMASVTADVICRTIFSQTFAAGTAHRVFATFHEFERNVATVNLRRLLFATPWSPARQPRRVLDACRAIRAEIDALIAPRLAPGAPVLDDIVGATIAARDPETGAPFTREELVDQLSVFFLAGHETTASALTWSLFIVSRLPWLAERIRAEVAQVAGDGPLRLEHAKRLVFVRNVLRETMRLYPPITFLPRVAAEATELAGLRLRRGTMVMIAPWTIHRHARIWQHADRFDPDRWAPEREGQVPAGAYLPFGLGPRVCVGAAFATLEATMILGRLVRRYDVETLDAERVRPVARLTTRPATAIRCRVRRRTA